MNFDSYFNDRSYRLNDSARVALVSFAVQVFEDCKTMEELTLSKFSDVAEEGERLIQALSGSQITKLSLLDLYRNPAWFENEENALVLADFVTRQNNLRSLNLGANGFSRERKEVWAEMNEMFTQMPNFKNIKIRRW